MLVQGTLYISFTVNAMNWMVGGECQESVAKGPQVLESPHHHYFDAKTTSRIVISKRPTLIIIPE